MASAILEIFQQALDQAELVEQIEAEGSPGGEVIYSDLKDPVDEPIVNASFVYSILNGDSNSPHLTVGTNENTTEDLDCLAKLIAPMSHPQFFYLIMNKIREDFTSEGRDLDYSYFLKKVEEQKAEFDSQMGEPYITPLDLSRRGNNE